MPYNKTHIGGLLEEGREGADKGREREAEIGTRVVEGKERGRDRGRERKRKIEM